MPWLSALRGEPPVTPCWGACAAGAAPQGEAEACLRGDILQPGRLSSAPGLRASLPRCFIAYVWVGGWGGGELVLGGGGCTLVTLRLIDQGRRLLTELLVGFAL